MFLAGIHEVLTEPGFPPLYESPRGFDKNGASRGCGRGRCVENTGRPKGRIQCCGLSVIINLDRLTRAFSFTNLAAHAIARIGRFGLILFHCQDMHRAGVGA
jgi:hypothetical protein